MKKAAVFSLMAFYLLLSTGMYVCIMHCAAANVIRVSVAEQSHSVGRMSMSAMHCCQKPVKKVPAENKDCNNKHSNYQVTENIKPAASAILQLPVGDPAQLPAAYSPFASVAVKPVNTLARGPAPPLLSGRAYLIQIRSLLI